MLRAESADYNAIAATNWSLLKNLSVSPMEFEYRRLLPRDSDLNEAKRVGLVSHAMVLEPNAVADRYAIYPGKVRRGKEYDGFCLAHSGKMILNQKEFDRALGVAKAIAKNHLALEILSGKKEQIIEWTDQVTGIPCKARVDNYGERLVELKTTAVLDEFKFAQLAYRLKYHGQLAFYADGLASQPGAKFKGDPYMVVVQSEPPHDVIVYEVIDAVIDLGRNLYRDLLSKLSHCQQIDSWPGKQDGQAMYFDFPQYVYNAEAAVITHAGEPMRFD